MTLAGAMARLALISVSGVTSYAWGLPAMPPHEAGLPCLVIVGDSNKSELQIRSITGSAGTMVVAVSHLLLYSGIGMHRLPERVDVLAKVDLYAAAIKADWTLNDELAAPLTISPISIGQIEFLGMVYYGVSFRHLWEIKV